MSDQSKREHRQQKRELKRAGGKRRRLGLKRSLEANPEDAPFAEPDFGRCRTAPLNGNDRDSTRKRPTGRGGVD